MKKLKIKLAKVNVRRKVLAATVGLVSLIILVVPAYSQQQVLTSYSWHLNWWTLSLAAIVFAIDLLLVACIWGAIMRSLGARLPLSMHVRYYCLANIGKRLPGTIWYVAGRSYLYNQDGVGVGLVSAGSSIEFVVALLSGICVSLLFAFQLVSDNRAITGGLLTISAVLLILFCGGGLRMILRKIGVNNPDGINLVRFGNWLLVYAVAWILGGILLYLIANSVTFVGIEKLGNFVGIWSLAGVLSSSLFFLPLNMGVTAVSISLLLSNLMPLPVAVIVTVLLWGAITIFELIAALACMLLMSIDSGGHTRTS